MSFDNILTAIGSYAFPIIVTLYLLYERATYIKEQSKILGDLKETVALLNDNLRDIKTRLEVNDHDESK